MQAANNDLYFRFSSLLVGSVLSDKKKDISEQCVIYKIVFLTRCFLACHLEIWHALTVSRLLKLYSRYP